MDSKEIDVICIFQTISDEVLLKFYRRIGVNTENYFSKSLPNSNDEWHEGKNWRNRKTSHDFNNEFPTDLVNQNTPIMAIACEKILRPLLVQLNTSTEMSTSDTYQQIVTVFIDHWTRVVRERKYLFSWVDEQKFKKKIFFSVSFSEETIQIFQSDHDYLRKFFTELIHDKRIISELIESNVFQRVPEILKLLKFGDKDSLRQSGKFLIIVSWDKWALTNFIESNSLSKWIFRLFTFEPMADTHCQDFLVLSMVEGFISGNETFFLKTNEEIYRSIHF